ncbi:MAG: hypothetical protein J6U54_01165 [Clostridiales bacterium]|nr:hypothetical protein [Clostridiales bacterium]
MKLRENVPRYNIEKHGNLYVNPEAITVICPECGNIELHKSENSDIFECPECGCTFETWIGRELTKTGKVVHIILLALTIIFCVMVLATLIGGLAWYGIKKEQLGEDAAADAYQTKVVLFCVIAPLTSIILAAVCSGIDNEYV